MATVAAIGERVRVRGLALAGVDVHEAEDPRQARAAWSALPADVELVVVTPRAARALGERGGEGGPLTVVLPVWPD
ncbi:hypothetical protein ACH4UM_38780 [Streptomyces sp. NPDC020801]|uniref:hypothetical protein n=1 Tax=unclassified Streptomyces TaxID=2593676 RepID=UPI0037B99D54